MDNFVNYVIKELKKRYLYELDKKYLEYVELYLEKYPKLPLELTQHLSNLYWYYKED